MMDIKATQRKYRWGEQDPGNPAISAHSENIEQSNPEQRMPGAHY